MALENGEAVTTPPAIWIQGRPDPVHDYPDPESELGRKRARAIRRNATARPAVRHRSSSYIGQENRASECLTPLTRFLAANLER